MLRNHHQHRLPPTKGEPQKKQRSLSFSPLPLLFIHPTNQQTNKPLLLSPLQNKQTKTKTKPSCKSKALPLTNSNAAPCRDPILHDPLTSPFPFSLSTEQFNPNPSSFTTDKHTHTPTTIDPFISSLLFLPLQETRQISRWWDKDNPNQLIQPDNPDHHLLSSAQTFSQQTTPPPSLHR